MFHTIKAKIILLTFSLLCLLSLVLTGAAFRVFHHDKELIVARNAASIASFEGQLNTEIAELEKNVLDLSLIGELYYQNGKQQSEGEFFVKQLLENYPNSMGNGIWFEPYAADKNRKALCIHALWGSDGKIELLPSCVWGDYDYFKQDWYAEIMKNLKKGHHLSWSKPYKSSQVEILMTTLGTPIYNQDKVIGMAMVDWQMDTILKSILKIKPTPNSFVLFADKANDYIIATTEPGINNDVIVGKSLANLKWYSKNLKDGISFNYQGVKYIPYIKDLNNDLFLVINIPVRELFQDGVQHFHEMLSLLLMGSFLIVGVLYFVLRRNINQPISQLTEMAQEIGQGNLNVQIHLDKPKELAQLASVLNQMTTDIKTHITQKERIKSEFAIAKTIQSSALPKDFPNQENFELQASMTPARDVGGDFYDFFPIDKRYYAFVMADVSGKGITAALYMMSAKTIIKNMLQAGNTLSEAAVKINQGLYDNRARGMFVTAFIGILDKKTGRVDYINAGHCPPLHKTKTGYQYVNVVRNLVFGVTPSYVYQLGHFTLKPNERLFLYTDGVTEAQTKNEKLYGPERLKKVLNQKDGSVSDTLNRVRKGISLFTKGAAQSDDITMMEILFHKKVK